MFHWLPPIFHCLTGNEAVLRTCKLEFSLKISRLLAIFDRFSDTTSYTPASIPRRWIIFSVNRYNRLTLWKRGKSNFDKNHNFTWRDGCEDYSCVYPFLSTIFCWARGTVIGKYWRISVWDVVVFCRGLQTRLNGLEQPGVHFGLAILS